MSELALNLATDDIKDIDTMETNFGIMNLKVQCQGNKFLKPCSVIRPFQILLRKSLKVAKKYAKKLLKSCSKLKKLFKNFVKLLEYF